MCAPAEALAEIQAKTLVKAPDTTAESSCLAHRCALYRLLINDCTGTGHNNSITYNIHKI